MVAFECMDAPLICGGEDFATATLHMIRGAQQTWLGFQSVDRAYTLLWKKDVGLTRETREFLEVRESKNDVVV